MLKIDLVLNEKMALAAITNQQLVPQQLSQ
jgi:hypothetical protein